MQTELKTAKDEKLVDLDVSGEGAEVELEDKSHGVVAPEKYEEVKTEEKDPLEPAVQEQAEEMDQYSDKVKKRIDKLTFKVREAEREREAALVFAQNVQKELSEAKQKTYDIDKGYMGESEVRNKMASDLARENLIRAREAGDYTKEEEARQALTKLDLEAERIRVTKQKKEQEYEAFQKELESQPAAQLQALQMQRAIKIDEEIAKITEQMVLEEAESMQDQNMDPLVLLKQQELALRQAEMEMDSQLKGEQQGLKENQFDYKQVLDAQKLQKDYDLANLRANVARERANATKQEG